MAKPKQTRSLATDFFDDDSDAPEAVSFGASKKTARGEQEAREAFASEERKRRREKNREKDHVLKERAALAGGKKKKDDETEERDPLQERMARAMREAEQEDSEEEGMSEGASAGDSKDVKGDEWGGIGGARDEENDEDEVMSDGEDGSFGSEESEEEDGSGLYNEDEEGEEGEEEENEDEDEDEENMPPPTKCLRKDYLPDHLFASAFATSDYKASELSKPTKASQKAEGKRKRANRPGKDVVLGSRTIRILPPPSSAIPSAENRKLVPPGRINRFVKRSLNLKGSPTEMKTKGWERRAANLGVMKRNGPAANFVRAR